MKKLDRPIIGRWPFENYPPSVIVDGSVFDKSEMTWPFYSSVRAQYRQRTKTNSMHMLVRNDASFVIDHIDESNPDKGGRIAHFTKDVLQTPTGKVAKELFAFVAGLVGTAVVVRKIRKLPGK